MVLAGASHARAQEAGEGLSTFNQRISQAKQLSLGSRYAESVQLLQEAQTLANDSAREDWYAEATIALAEVMRASFEFDRGMDLLRSLEGTNRYPKLHVQKLGRIAAIYAQGYDQDSTYHKDSLTTILSRAIVLSVQHGLLAEEASLRNELGFFQSRAYEFETALPNLQQSANLFLQVGDSINWAGSMTNIVDLYVVKGDFHMVDSIGPPLYNIVLTHNWHAVGSRLCSYIAGRHHLEGDTIRHAHWASSASAHTVEHMRAIFNSQVAAYKVLQDMDQVEAELRQSELELQEEKLQSRELYAYLTGMLMIVLAVVPLWWRERASKAKLNKTVAQLNQANEAYHMLILESNHRIKNNLQMITSMLRYTKRNMDPAQQQLINNLSAKVQTISSLHKHLYVEVHNELIRVDTYFEEVVAMYKEITAASLEVELDVGEIEIRSERMVYFGLVFNELLSNTIEHSPDTVHKIRMQIRKLEDHRYEFWYSDGSANMANVDLQLGTGVTLIERLIKRVRGTNYQWNAAAGSTRFEFEAGKPKKQQHPLRP